MRCRTPLVNEKCSRLLALAVIMYLYANKATRTTCHTHFLIILTTALNAHICMTHLLYTYIITYKLLYTYKTIYI